MNQHDLLTEPILSWRDSQHRRAKTTLPGVLARLSVGELIDFSGVRAHQLDPWAMFLAQLASIAMQRGGHSDIDVSEEVWRERLLALTDGEPEPWCLVVPDVSKAAFFQAPVPEGTTDAWNGLYRHPDEADVLVTSKQHDVKTGRVGGTAVEAWIYSLIALQTMQGYPGRGYNRISRMKGGYGSRPRLGLASDESLSARFVRDVAVLNDGRAALVDRGYSKTGLGLVWTMPWDGSASLDFADLAPHFVEICWRVRLRQDAQGISCLYTTTAVRRCLPSVEDGDMGDPWIPIERDKGALTVGPNGFDYKLLARVLFEGGFADAPAQTLRHDDGARLLMQFSVMSRGQGKTEGLHRRSIVFAGPARLLLGQPDGRDLLGRRASAAVQQAAKMRTKVLFGALKQVALGETIPPECFDARVDDAFFDALLTSLEMNDDDARLDWERTLRDIAWSELQGAIDRCAVPDARRYRQISQAEGFFRASLKKQFPDLWSEQTRRDNP